MLNDRSSLLSFLKTRRSAKPRVMAGGGPTGRELDEILTMAARTPDHGKLTPWRFVVIEDAQRDAFGALLRQALSEEDDCATIAHHNKEDEFAHYGGTLVVLVSAPTPGHKIPVWEQELSCGAAGMNLMLGAQALGYDVGWVTGWRAYSPRVSAALCEPGERIAGFIFIGHSGVDLEERPRPELGDVVRRWTPPL
ncbi:MAG TPA: nitroreductase [Sphingomicrobium sp.]|jgi:nitroreductase|nr:nitroreductase [Sphingomicrobium sp.]